MKTQNTPGFLKTRQALVISKHLDPSQILVIGFLVVILVGTILLMLPISSNAGESTSFINAFFTATSAVCVTGLAVVNTLAYWSTFGKVVILICIQIGGLGFMTLVSALFLVARKRISLKNRLIMQEALNQDKTAGIVRFTKNIIIGTFLVEAIGALLLAVVFVPEHGFLKGMGYAVFHSISAFCNAGFDIVGDNSLTPYVGNTMLNFTVMGLIVLGGLGFSVWLDTYKTIKLKLKSSENFTWKQAFYKLTLHTKLVWVITLALLIIGFVFFFVAELNNMNTLGDLSFKEKIYAAMFLSVTPRTAGFNTITTSELTTASKIMTMLMMFIGGSPAGTAGGIKTVTAGVLMLCAICTIRGKQHTVIFKKKIPFQIIARSMAIIMIAIGVVISVLMVLSFTESASFMELVFEVISAFGTVGLSLGITSNLTFIGKLIIIVTMFIGRLGPITMAVALMIKQSKDKGTIQYAEERVLVG
ncbi:TrkH family potassium uptake protein [Cellulosilyticum sp. I15G10I2]|uniref:TrkH family potassium uptake protein n=1 Tax=Cellulosilyticum sp. I15G10I2 TaxID=1892843 RepID=UPI00085BB20C|nr:TrkH family potassium uptake protein [Cellulosilyticum sp. I15G10I2]